MSIEKCYKAINDIDDLNTRLACGLNALSAIHEAILYGTLEAEYWKDGLWFVCDSLNDVQKQIQAVIDGCEMQPAAPISLDRGCTQ